VPPASAEALAAALRGAERSPAGRTYRHDRGGGAVERLYGRLIAWVSRFEPGNWRGGVICKNPPLFGALRAAYVGSSPEIRRRMSP